MRTTVSIIIPTYNRCTDLLETLISIERQSTADLEVDVLIVDNASTDETASLVRSYSQSSRLQIQYLHEAHNGLHACRHAGARYSKSRILVYVDDDVCAAEGWLLALCRPFIDPRVGVVGGKVIPDWIVPPPAWVHAMPAGYLSLLDLGNASLDLKWPYQVYGCNMAIRRSVIFDVHGFNPDGFSDPALQWLRGDGETGLLIKAYSAGILVRYEPSAILYHRIPSSRLTLDYFRRRAFNQGISDGYTFFRSRRFPILVSQARAPVKPHGWRLLGKIWQFIIKNLAMDLASLHRMNVFLFYLFARMEYVLRFLISAQLRAHVYRENYLDE